MRTGTDKNQTGIDTANFVNNNPVRLYMAVEITFISTLQGMILILSRQYLFRTSNVTMVSSLETSFPERTSLLTSLLKSLT